MSLTGKQLRTLRGLGHHLKPVVMVGKAELNEQVIAATEEALDSHELIKVKLQEGCLAERRSVAEQLAAASGAQIVQVLGRNILLYRAAPEPRLHLPHPS